MPLPPRQTYCATGICIPQAVFQPLSVRNEALMIGVKRGGGLTTGLAVCARKVLIPAALALCLSPLAPLRSDAALSVRSSSNLHGWQSDATRFRCGEIYVVRKGDTLAKIARACGVRASRLRRLNHLSRDARLYAGQRLWLTSPQANPAGDAGAPRQFAYADPSASTGVISTGRPACANDCCAASSTCTTRRPL